MRKNLQKRKIPFLISLIAAALVLLGMYFNYREEKSGMLDTYTWKETADGQYGMQCFSTGLERGTHRLFVAYHSEEELPYQILDLQQNDGNNHRGKVIKEGVFAGGEERMIEFTLQKATSELVLYVKTEDSSVQMGYWILRTSGENLRDYLFWFLLFAVTAFLLIQINDWNRWGYWIVAFGAGLILSLPYAGETLNVGDDLYFHLERIRGIADALQSGQFPVRISAAFLSGYGFSNDMMYPELFLYVPALLYMAGISLMTAYKFLILCVNLAAAGVGYFSFRGILSSEKLGLVCSLLYLLNPYRLMNIFHREATGEMLAQIFLPLLLYGMYELICGNYKKWWIVVVAATGIVQSHILSVEMSIGFVVLSVLLSIPYFVRQTKDMHQNTSEAGRLKSARWWSAEWVQRFVAMIKAGVVVIGINLWFIVPFLDHLRDDNYIRTQATDMQNSALDLYEIFRILPVFQGPHVVEGGVNRQYFATIGCVLLFGVFIYLYYAFIKKSLNVQFLRIGNVCLGLGILSCYLTTRCFPWNCLKDMEWLYPMVGVIQFPWRFLAYASVFLSVVTTIAVAELIREKRKMAIGVLVGISLFIAFGCMDQYVEKPVALSGKNDVVKYISTYLDYYAKDTVTEELLAQGDTVASDSDIEISNYRRNGMELSFDYRAAKLPCTLNLPIYNYGMAGVFLDGEEMIVGENHNHLLTVEVQEGKEEGHIEVRYQEHKLYKLSTCVSILVVSIWVALGIWRKRNLRKNTL
ncbi:MAG: hypothetical protein HFH53_10430 [Hespellia sp.]|nr:hypothetical protein [Hespellia sp.]